MVNRILLSLSFLLIFAEFAVGQATTFRRSYNVGLFDNAGNMAQTVDGGYIFGGINATGLTFYGGLTKTDANGDVEWSNAYISGFASVFTDVKPVSTGGYIATGSSTSGGGGAVLVRVDANGNVIWANRYQTPNNFPGKPASSSANAVIEAQDGGFVVAGSVSYFWDGVSPSTIDTSSALGFKVDASGNIQWSSVWAINVTNPDEHFFNDVTETADGFIFVGASSEGQGTLNSDGDYPRNAFIVKANKTNGNTIFINRWGAGNSNSESISSALTLTNGSVLIAGGDSEHAFLRRISGTGASFNHEWGRRINGSSFPPQTYLINSIAETSDNQYAFIGTRIATVIAVPPLVVETILGKINPSNNAIPFIRAYPSLGLSSILPQGGVTANDEFYTVMTDQQISGFNYNMIKTDNQGLLNSSLTGCDHNNRSPSTSNYNPSIQTIPNSYFTGLNRTGYTPVVTATPPTEVIHCLTTVCTPPPLADNVTATPNPICAGESTTINATGPGTNVSYNVYDAATGGTNLGEVPVVVSPGTTTTYYIETFNTTDPTCVSTSRVPITVTVNPSPVVNPQSNSPLCVGETLNLTTDAVAGGTYAWTGPNGFTSSDQNPTISNAQLVNGGTYSLTVTAGGCSTGPATVEVIVSETPTSSPSAVNTAVCEGQDIELIGNTVPGGSYSWNGPGGFVSSDQNPVINGATSADAGNYSLVISVGSCSSTSQSVTISVNPAPTATAANDGPVCEGNTITLSATGGTSYSWTGPDGFNSNGSPVSVNNATIANGGVYEVTVTDGNGCTATAQTTVVITNGPALSIAGSDVLCNGDTNGSATVTPTGDAPFTYSWSPLGGTDATANNLAPGAYEVTVIDVNGCQSNESVVIGEPDALSLSTSTTSSQCTVDDGTAEVIVSGGTAPYSYSWSSGGTAATETNIGPGVYTVIVTDDNGCSAQAQATVSSVNGPTASLESSTNITCFGASDGAAAVVASGGTPGYTYSWSPSGGTNASATGLSAGPYTVTVTDAAGCQDFVTIEITEPAALNAAVTASDANCGVNDGAIALAVTGGTPSYTYTWTPNIGNTATVSNLAAGAYSVEIEDANGCSIVVNQNINTTGFIPIEIVPETAVIEAGDNVQIEVVIGGGVTNADIIWTPSTGLSCTTCPNPIAEPSETTTYFVTVTTDDGCISSDSITVFVNQPCGELFVPNIFSPNGDGNNDFLCVYGSCFESFNFSIFSRWGEKVFESGDAAECWDGTFRNKEMNSGVFVYKLVVKIVGEAEERVESGNINLVR